MLKLQAKTSFKKLNLKPLFFTSIFLLSTTTVLAQDSLLKPYDANQAEKERHSNEAKSLLGGAVVGGIIAGPPGAIIVGVISAIVSNNNSTEKDKEHLQASLAHSQTELIALQEQQAELQALYHLALEDKQNNSFINTNLSSITPTNNLACCTDTEIALHFRSNSTDIEQHYLQQLAELARLSKTIPDAIIEVTGYSDRRGSDNANLGLSRRRVNAVESSLVSLGISRRLIQSSAFGETQPLNSIESLEGNFFDRRVNVKLRSNKNDLITFSNN